MDDKGDNTYLEVSLVNLNNNNNNDYRYINSKNTHNSNHINVLCFSADKNIKLNEVVY